jgi:hypothetical protein
MKKILVILVAIQAIPSFASTYIATEQTLCMKYGCTIQVMDSVGAQPR